MFTHTTAIPAQLLTCTTQTRSQKSLHTQFFHELLDTRNAGLGTMTQVQSPSPALCLLETLGKAQNEAWCSTEADPVAQENRLHTLLCFCRVAREHCYYY